MASVDPTGSTPIIIDIPVHGPNTQIGEELNFRVIDDYVQHPPRSQGSSVYHSLSSEDSIRANMAKISSE
jgi:hypothetical protein